MAYTKYSLTPANNTAAPPDGAPEGMLPSAVNDTMRDMMSQIRDVGDGVRDGTYTMTAPKITGGTITGVTLTGNTLTNPVITGATLTTSAFNGTVGATTASTGAFTTLSTSSTTTFSGLTASTALALDASKNVVSVTNTGTGSNVLSASPTLTGTIAGASLSLSSLTSGRVTFAGASGLLTDSANLLYSGTDLTVYGITVGRGPGASIENTTVGSAAFSSNSSGTQNVAVGRLAMQQSTSSSYSVAVGNAALQTLSTGSYNTAIGTGALQLNTTASNNTAVGYQAGYSNTTGSLTTVGYLAGYSNSTGTDNSSFGSFSLRYTTTGAGNSGYGAYSLTNNTTGSSNTAVGMQALQANTTASNNTAVGYQAGYLVTTGAKNTILGSYSGNQGGLDIRTASNFIVLSDGDGNPRQVINSSGNVGIGTSSPSASGTGGTSKVLEVNGDSGYGILNLSTTATASGSTTGLLQFCSELGSDDRIAIISAIKDDASTTTPKGYLYFATANAGGVAERMRITSAGNVGIGTSSPSCLLEVNQAATSFPGFKISGNSSPGMQIVDASGVTAHFANDSAGTYFGTTTSNPLIFRTVNTERMRIDSSGRLLIGTTSSIADSGGAYFQISTTKVNWLSFVEDTGTAGNVYCQYLRFGGYSPNDANSIFLYCGDTTGQRMSVRANGGIYNYSANDSNLSDEREKKNIELAPNYLDKICQIPVKTFLYNDQTDTDLNLGVIAQDVEAICPELIMESNWASKDEAPKIRKSIYQTDLQYALMKCIQEQQALIESLTTRLTNLENK